MISRGIIIECNVDIRQQQKQLNNYKHQPMTKLFYDIETSTEWNKVQL